LPGGNGAEFSRKERAATLARGAAIRQKRELSQAQNRRSPDKPPRPQPPPKPPPVRVLSVFGRASLTIAVRPLRSLAVQRGDGLVGLFLVRHLDEAEAAGLPAILVLDDRRGGDVAGGRERFAQFAFVQAPLDQIKRKCAGQKRSLFLKRV